MIKKVSEFYQSATRNKDWKLFYSNSNELELKWRARSTILSGFSFDSKIMDSVIFFLGPPRISDLQLSSEPNYYPLWTRFFTNSKSNFYSLAGY